MLSGATFRATALSLALLAAFHTPLAAARAAGPAPGELNGYNFAYAATGSPQVSPVQVFDDGHATYFQFRDLSHVPAIIRLEGDHRTPVPQQIKPPYVVINEVGSKYLLQMGHQTALVDRISDGPTPSPTRTASSSTELLFPDRAQAAPDWRQPDRPAGLIAPPRFHTGPPVTVPAPAVARPYQAAGRGAPAEPVQDLPASASSGPAAQAGLSAAPAGTGTQQPQNTDQMRLQVIQKTLNLLGDNRISQDLAANVIREAAGAAPSAASPWKHATGRPARKTASAKRHHPGRHHPVHHAGRHPPHHAVPTHVAPVARQAPQDEGQPIAEYSGNGTVRMDPSWQPAPTRNATPARNPASPDYGKGAVTPDNLDVRDSAWKPEWLPSKPLILQKARSMSPEEAVRYVRPFLKTNVQFTVRENEKLSEAIRALATQNDWQLEWETDKDFTVLYGYTVSGDSLEYVLQKALASYGLKATLYSINRVIVIQSLDEPRTVG